MIKHFFLGVFLLVASFASAFEAKLFEENGCKVAVSSNADSVDIAHNFELILSVVSHKVGELPDPVYMRTRFRDFKQVEGYPLEAVTLTNGLVKQQIRYKLVPGVATKGYRLAPFVIRIDGEEKITSPVVFPVAELNAKGIGELDVPTTPYNVPITPKEIAKYVGLFFASVALIWLIIYLIKRAKASVLFMTPAMRAMAELKALLGKRLVEQGLFKDFFVELTFVVRRYIERAHGIRAPKQTTEEFLENARQNKEYSDEVLEKLASFLHAADMIKFAQKEATHIDEAIKTAEDFIKTDEELMKIMKGKNNAKL